MIAKIFAASLIVWVSQAFAWTGLGGAQNLLAEAEALYDSGRYTEAIEALRAVPGFDSPLPAMSPLDARTRAMLYLDLAACHQALDDSDLAMAAVRKAMELQPDVKRGHFRGTDMGPLRRQVQAAEKTRRLMTTTSASAFTRSLVVPGWGQIHRGHEKRGLLMMAATFGAAGMWFAKYRAFCEARDDYNALTRADLNVTEDPDGRLRTEFDRRYEIMQSRSGTANRLLMVAAGLYLLNLTDSIVIGPGVVGVKVEVGGSQ